MQKLRLEHANAIIKATLAEARRRELSPLSVAVLDPGGHTISLQREDNASMIRCEVAVGKAYGALALGVGSRKVSEMAIERPHLLAGLMGVSDGKIVPLPGGVLIMSNDEILGAVGVTGDTSENDEACALVAIEEIGLAAVA